MQKFKLYCKNLTQKLFNCPIFVGLGQKIIIATTVITAVLVGILAWVIKPNPNINTAAVQLAQTANNIRMFYQTKPGYWGLNTDNVIKNNLQTSGMLSKGKLINAFGKPVIIGQDIQGNVAMPGSRNFMITFPDLDKSECIAMAAFKLNERENLSLLQMVIINEQKQYEFTWGGENSLPVKKTDAVKFCAKNNTIAWSFE